MTPIDPVELSRRLIKCRSVTPEDGGALEVLENVLKPLGFQCHRLRFEDEASPAVDNLYARVGSQGPNF